MERIAGIDVDVAITSELLKKYAEDYDNADRYRKAAETYIARGIVVPNALGMVETAKAMLEPTDGTPPQRFSASRLFIKAVSALHEAEQDALQKSAQDRADEIARSEREYWEGDQHRRNQPKPSDVLRKKILDRYRSSGDFGAHLHALALVYRSK